jgi:hypothetical protein
MWSLLVAVISGCVICGLEKEFVKMRIGQAVEALEDGERVTRSGWNGRGMSLELQVPDAHSKMTEPYVFLNTWDGKRVPWVCSQADLLANDWHVVGRQA